MTDDAMTSPFRGRRWIVALLLAVLLALPAAIGLHDQQNRSVEGAARLGPPKPVKPPVPLPEVEPLVVRRSRRIRRAPSMRQCPFLPCPLPPHGH